MEGHGRPAEDVAQEEAPVAHHNSGREAVTDKLRTALAFQADGNERRRTFELRKNALLKKGEELALLCRAQVTMILFDHDVGKLVEYSSIPTHRALVRYAQHTGLNERHGAGGLDAETAAAANAAAHISAIRRANRGGGGTPPVVEVPLSADAQRRSKNLGSAGPPYAPTARASAESGAPSGRPAPRIFVPEPGSLPPPEPMHPTPFIAHRQPNEHFDRSGQQHVGPHETGASYPPLASIGNELGGQSTARSTVLDAGRSRMPGVKAWEAQPASTTRWEAGKGRYWQEERTLQGSAAHAYGSSLPTSWTPNPYSNAPVMVPPRATYAEAVGTSDRRLPIARSSSFKINGGTILNEPPRRAPLPMHAPPSRLSREAAGEPPAWKRSRGNAMEPAAELKPLVFGAGSAGAAVGLEEQLDTGGDSEEEQARAVDRPRCEAIGSLHGMVPPSIEAGVGGSDNAAGARNASQPADQTSTESSSEAEASEGNRPSPNRKRQREN